MRAHTRTHTHPYLCWKCSWLPELLLAEGPVFRYNPLIAACVLGAGLLRKPGFPSPSPLGVRVGVSGSPLTPLPSFLLLFSMQLLSLGSQMGSSSAAWATALLARRHASGTAASVAPFAGTASLVRAEITPDNCAPPFQCCSAILGLLCVPNNPFVVAPGRGRPWCPAEGRAASLLEGRSVEGIGPFALQFLVLAGTPSFRKRARTCGEAERLLGGHGTPSCYRPFLPHAREAAKASVGQLLLAHL